MANPETDYTGPFKEIANDGMHTPNGFRRWLARQLMDSRLTPEEAYGIVAHHPLISDQYAAALPCKGGATNDHLHFAVSTFLARYKGNNGLEAMREATAPMFAALPCKGGEADMRKVCEALGFDPTNHHNATKCPYCTPTTEPDTGRGLREALEAYDAGLLSDYGGGNVDWWQDYLRAELGRAHDFYADQIAATPLTEALRPFAEIGGELHPSVRGVRTEIDADHIRAARQALAALSDTPRGRESSSREALTHPKVDVGPLPHAITEQDQVYRGYRITFDPKPIPASCGVDWTYVHEDYDGPEDRRCGCAASAAACRVEIDILEDAQ